MLLIQENTGVIGNDFVVNKTENDDYYIEGIFIKADIPNANGRIYPKAYLEEGIARYNKEFIQSKKSIGELDHPTPPRSDALLSERALRVESLEMQSDGTVIGKAIVLKHSKMGRELKGVIDEGTAFGTSFRAMTQLKQGSDGYTYCGPDIYFRAFDAVLIPSVGEDVAKVEESVNSFENVWYAKEGEMTTVKPEFVEEAISDFNQKWSYTDGELVKDDKIVDVNEFKNAFL